MYVFYDKNKPQRPITNFWGFAPQNAHFSTLCDQPVWIETGPPGLQRSSFDRLQKYRICLQNLRFIAGSTKFLQNPKFSPKTRWPRPPGHPGLLHYAFCPGPGELKFENFSLGHSGGAVIWRVLFSSQDRKANRGSFESGARGKNFKLESSIKCGNRFSCYRYLNQDVKTRRNLYFPFISVEVGIFG